MHAPALSSDPVAASTIPVCRASLAEATLVLADAHYRLLGLTKQVLVARRES